MISFVNSFLSYIMLMIVIVIVAGCGFVLGFFLRKKKNQTLATEMQENTEE